MKKAEKRFDSLSFLLSPDSFFSFRVVTALAACGKVWTVDELHRDVAPRAVALPVLRLIADAVDHAEIAYHLFINAAQVFNLACTVKKAAALSGKLCELLASERVRNLARAMLLEHFALGV